MFDRSSLTRWRNRMGEERLQALVQESLSVATRTKAIKPSELSRVIVDATIQPKNVMFPTDAILRLSQRLWLRPCLNRRQRFATDLGLKTPQSLIDRNQFDDRAPRVDKILK